MLRAIFVLIACVSLAGCWASEDRFFGEGDWADVDLEGRYTSQDANGLDRARVVLASRPDGLIESTSVGLDDGETENSVLGFVRIEGGFGNYFLAVDRSDENGDGDIYLIARLLEDGELELYWPDCSGTPPMEGLTIERETFTGEASCGFSSRAALMRAGLEAERFLSARHIVAVAPMGRLVPDGDEGNSE